MIDEARTLELFGYTSDELSKGSHKKIVAVCDECGHHRTVENRQCRDLCNQCSSRSPETRQRMVDAWKTRPMITTETRKRMSASGKGRILTEQHKQRIGDAHRGKKHSAQHVKRCADAKRGSHHSAETKEKISLAGTGRRHTKESLIKMSAWHQNVPVDMWEGFSDKGRPHVLPIIQSTKINNRFHGCVGHHLSKSLVIFIPKVLHTHIQHNIKTGNGMAEMNALALQFALTGDEQND